MNAPYSRMAAEQAVYEEMIETWNDLAGAHSVAISGLALIFEEIPSLEPDNPGPDSMVFFGHGDPSSEEGFVYQGWPWGSLPAKLGPAGPVLLALGQQWLVMVVAEWNDNFRPRFAEASGGDVSEINDTCMGDMNLMRNDIIHHRGIATAHNTARATVGWFKEGDEIRIYPEHVATFMDYFGLKRGTQDFGDDQPWKTWTVS